MEREKENLGYRFDRAHRQLFHGTNFINQRIIGSCHIEFFSKLGILKPQPSLWKLPSSFRTRTLVALYQNQDWFLRNMTMEQHNKCSEWSLLQWNKSCLFSLVPRITSPNHARNVLKSNIKCNEISFSIVLYLYCWSLSSIRSSRRIASEHDWCSRLRD